MQLAIRENLRSAGADTPPQTDRNEGERRGRKAPETNPSWRETEAKACSTPA